MILKDRISAGLAKDYKTETSLVIEEPEQMEQNI
jgi:hypothetical protein